MGGASDMSGVALDMMSGPHFWLTAIVLAPAMSLLPDIVHMTFQRTFAPKAFQILQVRGGGRWELCLEAK